MRPIDVRQRLLRCDGVTDGDLVELTISLVLDQVTIELLGALFDFRHKLGFLGSWVQEMRLSQVLDPPLLHSMCLIETEHLGKNLPMVRQRP